MRIAAFLAPLVVLAAVGCEAVIGADFDGKVPFSSTQGGASGNAGNVSTSGSGGSSGGGSGGTAGTSPTGGLGGTTGGSGGTSGGDGGTVGVDAGGTAGSAGSGAAAGADGGPCNGSCSAAECCDGVCMDLLSDDANCGACGTVCRAGLESCCGGTCTGVTLDEQNCGACGAVCPGTICFGGECSTTCDSPFENCNQNIALDGCEADLSSNPAHCGGCFVECPAGAICDAGSCACAAGLLDCDGNPLNGCETDITSDPLNCGDCNSGCAQNKDCVSGTCACAPGYDDCNADGTDGCEADLGATASCASCANDCGASSTCSSGSCGCLAGLGNCDALPGCEASLSAPAHCGACGNACSASTPVCDGATCVSGCATGNELCSGACVDPDTNPQHCGGCGLSCGTNAVCNARACECLDGFQDCDQVPGCETPTTDVSNCGACGNVCLAGAPFCDGTSCVGGCSGSEVLCTGGCVDTTTDPQHCGACDQPVGANAICVASVRQCLPGFLHCSGGPQNGCETAATSATDCGACGNACTGSTPVCDGVQCVSGCDPGQTRCGAACVDTLTDPLNCGGCGQAVGAHQQCVGGAKVCLTGWSDCNQNASDGCEVDTTTDATHCGACGAACKPGAACSASTCACAAATPRDCGADCRVCCTNSDCADGDGCTQDVCAANGASCGNPSCAAGTQCCSAVVCQECCTNADCAAGETCSGGICSSSCGGGLSLCDGSCVDPTSNPNHCNGCGISCGSDGTCACASAACSGGTVYFSEDFSDNFKGWFPNTSEFQIGPATASSGQDAGNPDPGVDHSATEDNGVAGFVIGGNYSLASGFRTFTSPVIDLSTATGTVKLTFWRWLNAGEGGGMLDSIQVKDGPWRNLWEAPGPITDSGWTRVEYDVTAYKAADFQFRFIHNIFTNSDAVVMSGWNIDDVTLSSGTCN